MAEHVGMHHVHREAGADRPEATQLRREVHELRTRGASGGADRIVARGDVLRLGSEEGHGIRGHEDRPSRRGERAHDPRVTLRQPVAGGRIDEALADTGVHQEGIGSMMQRPRRLRGEIVELGGRERAVDHPDAGPARGRVPESCGVSFQPSAERRAIGYHESVGRRIAEDGES